jgi:hypothetical protein
MVGPVDWSYDFMYHFQGYCVRDEEKHAMCERYKERLRQLTEIPEGERHLWQVQTSHEYWHDLLDVGMYDGWPFWKPVPHVFHSGMYGGVWETFSNITDIRRRT